MARNSSTKKAKTIQERLQTLLEKEQAVYEKERIARRFVITFPNRQKTPLLGRFGVYLLEKTRAVIQIQYDEIKQK